MKKAYKYSSRRTFSNWVESFLKDLKQAYNKSNNLKARYIYLGLSTEAAKMGHEKVLSQQLNIQACVSDFEYKIGRGEM